SVSNASAASKWASASRAGAGGTAVTEEAMRTSLVECRFRVGVRRCARHWRIRHRPVRSRHMSHLVVALAYDRLCTFEFGCVVEVFALPRPELGARWYRFAVCAAERTPLRALGGFTLAVPRSLRMLDRADTIIVPGWRDAHEPPPPALLDRLRAAHRRGVRICSICSGVFVLAAAGLLDGRRATTHWGYAKLLSERYPAIDVAIDELYVDEGPIVTSAGSAAGLDMMLHLVRRDHGARVANVVAQRL